MMDKKKTHGGPMRLAMSQGSDTPTMDSPGIVWEECACPLCGSASFSPFLEASDPRGGDAGLYIRIVRCNRCGLCFNNPRPDLVSIKQFYPADYRCHQTKPDGTKEGFWKANSIR